MKIILPAWLLFLSVASVFAQALEPSPNLIRNSNFENQVDEIPTDWTRWNPKSARIEDLSTGTVRVVLEQIQRGGAIETNFFSVVPHSLLSVKANLSGENIETGLGAKNWHGFRMTLGFYDANGENRVRHHEVMVATGSFDWTEARREYLVPDGAAQAKITFQLSEAKGAFRVRNPEARIVATLDGMREAAEGVELEQVLIIPKPAEVKWREGQLASTNWIVQTLRHDERLTGYLASPPLA